VVSLSAADGRNITVQTTTAGGTGTGLNAAASSAGTTTTSKLTLSSTGSAGITLGGTAGLTATGQTVGYTAATATAGAGVSSLDLSTAAGAQAALTTLDSALATVNSSRASLGAYQNRFSSVVTSLQTTSENLSASRSRIQDTDFAKETASLTRGQILQQAGTAMLAQANSLPNGVLALLRG
jgi:flagellin